MFLNRLILISIVTILLFALAGVTTSSAQLVELGSDGMDQISQLDQTDEKSPRGAFLRSLAVPGWGHFYAGKNHSTRGGIHLGADAVVLGSIFGFNIRANRLENDFLTFANLKAGVDLSSRNRSFRLAVADFNSLNDYNDYQLRTRNWNRLIEDTPDNRWNWSSAEDRTTYRDMRSDADRIRNQIPGLAGIMVVNRIISGISAYNRVRNDNESSNLSRTSVSLLPVWHSNQIDQSISELSGVTAKFTFRF